MQVIQSNHPRPLNRLAVGPGGLVVAASGPPGSAHGVEGWDAVTGAHLWTALPDRANIRHLAFALGGTHLFVADSGTQRLFEVPTASLPVAVARTGWAFSGVAVAETRAFVASDGEHPVLRCIDLPGLRDLWRRDGGNEFRDPRTEFGGSVAISSDGALLALFVRERGRGLPESMIVVHGTAFGVRQTIIPLSPARDVRVLAFTADGTKLLALMSDHVVEMFDSSTGIRAGAFEHPNRSPVTALAVHPQGPVACARTNGTVTFWDANTCEQIRTFDWQAGPLVSLAFGADGALGAAGTRDGTIVVWDVDL